MFRFFAQKEDHSLFLRGFLGGLGWAVGATLGFAIFVATISMLLNLLGGTPFIGSVLADIIHFTNEALKTKVAVTK